MGEAGGERQPVVEVSSLPDASQSEVDFLDTSFFQSNGASPLPSLPTPAEIYQKFHSDRGVFKFDSLNLVVKVGHPSSVRLEEAQAMIAVRRAFPNGEVPVPEVFGWRRKDGVNYIYMSLISGTTLGGAWPSLTDHEKESICGELSRIVAALRQVRQSKSGRFIGSISGSRIQDRYFLFDDEAGPLPDVESFNDLFLAAATRQNYVRGEKNNITGQYRELLPDTSDTYFTHGDLTLENIILSGSPGNRRVESIIDWEQAGWYPEYWEYCKLLYGVHFEHDWHTGGWAEKVVKPYEDEWWTFLEYFLWRGCP